ncbi:MAG: hypothetical protein ACR2QF_13345 [Geminicoccaceae bacterium]
MASGRTEDTAGAALAGRTKQMPKPNPVAATPIPRAMGRTVLDLSCLRGGLANSLS